jgi:uncharacterized protein involved in exopolysaccharide biosynthesis
MGAAVEGLPPAIDRVTLLEVGSEHRLLNLAQLFWDQRRRLLRITMSVSLLALMTGFFTPNIYRSTTRLMPPDKQNGSNLAALASRVAGSDLAFLADDLPGMQSTGALFVGVLSSRTTQEKIVEQFQLTEVYGNPWLHWQTDEEDACKQLEYNTEISEDRKSGIITISVVDHDRQRAAALAGGYVDQLNRLITTLSTSTAGRERQFLEQRLAEIKKDLDEASQRLSEFSSQNVTLDPKEQGRATVDAAAKLQAELMAAESELSGLQTMYTANNVRVDSLRARIAELKKQLGNLSGKTGASEFSTIDTTNSDMPFPSIRQLPRLDATYVDLFRRAKIEEALYQALTQQYEMAKVQETKEIPTVRVLDKANIPKKKWGPHRLLLAIMGAVAGLLFGCAWVIATDQWEKRDLQDPYKAFISDVVSHVPGHQWWRARRVVTRRVTEISRDHQPDLPNTRAGSQ